MSEVNPLAKSVITAVVLFVLDAFVLGQGVIAVITLLIVVFGFMPKAVIAFFKRRSPRYYLKKSLIYTVMAVGVLGVIFVNNRIARERAEHLIDKIEDYKTAEGKYPETLETLIPEHIDAIPKSKYTVSHNRFLYIYGKGGVLLGYVHLPPFGRLMYSFDTKKWASLD